MLVTCTGGVYGRGMVPGTGIRVVGGEGYTGTQPAAHRLLEEGTPDSEAGPRKPCKGLEWGGQGWTDVRWAGTAIPPPSGPGRSLAGPSLGNALGMPTWSQYGEI